MLDGALLAVRRGGGAAFVRGLLAGTPIALLALGIYYLERIEGIRTLRPLFALALTVAYLARCVSLSSLARTYALELRPTLPINVERAHPASVVTTSGVVGLGLWMWLWLLVGMAVLSPLAVIFVWPLLSVRGGVAPSWLARSACEPERGWAAFGQAFDDTAGMRGVFSVVELLTLIGAVGAFANLYAFCSVGLLLAHSMVGLDVALVSTFLSLDNTLVPLFVASLTLVLMEPLRAAISAQAFVDARSRRDGADLHAAIDRVIESSTSRTRGLDMRPPTVAALVLIATTSALHPTPALAEPDAPSADAPPTEARSGDAEVRQHVDEILARHEFREFADQDNKALRDLFERFFRWLEEIFESEEDTATREPSGMPAIPPWVLIALALLGLLLIASYAYSKRRIVQHTGATSRQQTQAILAQEPTSFLDEATRLAQGGDPRAALRALYVATLVTLDRARLIEFDPTRTNWQYLRGMPRGEVRDAFAAFTRLFDHKWYGHEPTTMEDYERGRALADRVCAEDAA